MKLHAFKRNNRGDGYVSTLFVILITMAFIVAIVNLLPIFTTKADVDYVTQQAVRTIELTGKKGEEYNELLTDIEDILGDSARVVTEGNFITIGGVEKLQLRDKFTVSVYADVKIPIVTPVGGDPVVLTVTVSKSLVGRSEIYWKDLA